MRVRFGAALASAIAIGFGIWTLIGLLIVNDGGFFYTLFSQTTAAFLQIVVIAVALTIVLGVINLLSVHFGRITGRRGGFVYSLVLLLSFLLVIGLTIFERTSSPDSGERALSMTLLETVQLSVESALAGLIVFALVYGAYRMMSKRVSWSASLFVTVLLLVLLGELVRRGVADVPLLANLSNWISTVPVSGGARGLLLGIALATVIAGVRVLIGQDRSYRE